MTLDRIDHVLLKALQKNARLSNKELAAHAGIAPSTCHERLRRLDERGVIRGFHARLDPKALGVGIQAMVAVRLRSQSRDLLMSFRDTLRRLEEVVAVFYMAGSNDFLVHIAVRDSEHLREVALTHFATRPEIGHMETALIFEHAGSGHLPIYSTEE
ncbi:MAG: Lrp/AsnC family transcriptional regulator [Acidobacteriota bacterium]